MRPEHADLCTPVFLPVTEQACASLLNTDGAKELVAFTDPELAAVLVIQSLAQASEHDLNCAAAERVLAKIIAWAVDANHSATVGLLSEAQRLFDPRKLYFGLNTLKKLNVRFLQADEVATRNYLLPDGKWDDGYKHRHHRANNPFSEQMVTPIHRERWLSAAQDRLVRVFRANRDEDLHVQGYAGIGKSHLLGALMECLKPESTLLLARTPEKLAALRKRMRGAYDQRVCRTFEAFARALLRTPKTRFERTALRRLSGQALSQELNILGFRSYDGQATLGVCLKILEQYCQSRDHTLSAKHLPHFKQALSGLEARVLLEYSSRVWTYLNVNPNWAAGLEFEALLLIKRASLEGCVVPSRYTHILIDESQDIPASLLQIIERGRQVLITLGDEYQQANTEIAHRKRGVRHSDVCYSVRSGPTIERLVNPLISRHSHKSKVPFEGARNADVGIEIYPLGFVPPEGCVVLTASLWDMMKWVIQLHDANCAFSFVDRQAHDTLESFIGAAIALFKPGYYGVENSTQGTHPYFSDLATWQQVRDVNAFDESFLWVEAELEKGFNAASVTQLNRMLGSPGKSCLLMLAQEAGGMEFDHVLLTPELLTNVMFKDAYEFDQRICAVYIAISRAKRQLYVPYDVVEWVEYHRDQGLRESHGY
ncbi:hypothetical protein SB766_02295 [Pseudomonas sp. SIMBA_077]